MRTVLAVLFTSGLLLCGTASTSWAQEGPSFDCAKAKAPDEKAICGDEELAALDRTIADGYALLTERLGRKTANKVHVPFLRARKACKSNADCIGGVMRREVPTFQALGFVAPDEQGPFNTPGYEGLKKLLRLGECSVGTIVQRGARLCSDDGNGNCVEDPDSGDSVTMSDGIYGVSYEKEKGLRKAKLGDPVLSCLAAIPEGCPPGDDRGYSWASKDLRTGGTWELPDSQHMCGGA